MSNHTKEPTVSASSYTPVVVWAKGPLWDIRLSGNWYVAREEGREMAPDGRIRVYVTCCSRSYSRIPGATLKPHILPVDPKLMEGK